MIKVFEIFSSHSHTSLVQDYMVEYAIFDFLIFWGTKNDIFEVVFAKT